MPTVAQCHAHSGPVPCRALGCAGRSFRAAPTDRSPVRVPYNLQRAPRAACSVSADTARTHVPSAPTDLILATLQSGMLLDVRPP